MKKIVGWIAVVVMFTMSQEVSAVTFDELYNQIAPNGKIELNSVVPKGDPNSTENEAYINKYLSDYVMDGISLYGHCDQDNLNKCHINMQKEGESGKSYDVEVTYLPYSNQDIYDKIQKILLKIPSANPDDITGVDESRLYEINDLEIINFMLAGGYSKDPDITIAANSEINYSTTFKQVLGNNNIEGYFYARAGWVDEFSSGSFGDIVLSYNDYMYGMVDAAGFRGSKVIFVDDNTLNTREAMMNAAQERLDDYLGKGKLEIKYAGKIDDLDDYNWVLKLDQLIDVSKTNGEYYSINILGYDYNFFIVRDSSKIKDPKLITQDLTTMAVIKSDNYIVPLDSNIIATRLNSNSLDYQKVLNHLNLDDGIIYDLKLYSNSTNSYVSKLNNDRFEVYIPITNDYSNETLVAYYIDENGNIEKHPVTVENGYAKFETDHFSTYTIGEDNSKIEVINPSTNDNIIILFVLFGWSIIGIILTKKHLRESK